MRRILVAASVLVALVVIAVAWKLRTPEPAAENRTATQPVEPTATALAQTPGELPRPGRRTEAAPVAAPADDANEAELAPWTEGISILLLDREGKPLPGKVLGVYWLEEGREMVLEDSTDAQGLLATPIPDPERLEGIVLDAMRAYKPFETAPDAPGVVVVRCPRPARLEGIVRDEQGRTIAGAIVEIEPQPVLGLEPFVARFVTERRDAETDAYGRFEAALAEGCFALAPSAEGYDATEVALPCVSGDSTALVDLVLRGSDREVQVEVRAEGKPFPQPVLVTATRAADGVAPGLLRDHFAIDRGGAHVRESLYSVRLSRDGRWTIAVTLAPGFAEARVPVGDADARIVVDLHRPEARREGTLVRGSVSTEAGRPLSAEVVVFHGANLDWAESERSDEAGSFAIEIDPREEDPLFILAREAGHGATGLGPLDPARLPTSIDLVLVAERTIGGVVVGPDGAGLPARLSIHPSRSFFAPLVPMGAPVPEGFFDEAAEAEASEEGTFTFHGLSAGAYAIWARATDPSLGLPPTCVVAQAGEANLRIELGSGLERFATLAGTVREAGTGRPIAGARVAAGLARGGSFRSEDSYTGEDGRYRLRSCPAERLALFVDAPGCAYSQPQVGPLPAGEHALDLEVLPERTLRLLVVDPSGTPVAGVYVSAADAEGRPVLLRNGDDVLVTDLAGRVDLHGLPAAGVAVIVGRRDESVRFLANAAYQAPDSTQPEPLQQRFDLKIPLDGIPRIVLPR